MRIISGERRGKKLLALEGLEVRPTADRVKEALFDIVQLAVPGCRFLDLFTGSGQVGLEAVSRGAALATLVDSSPRAIRVAEKNVQATGFSDRTQVIRADWAAFLRGAGRFDIAFLDPPYRKGILQEALPLTAQHMAPGGLIVCEHPAGEELPERAEGFVKARTYRYGKIALSLYREEEPA